MFEYRKTFKEGLALGLRKEKENPRNTEALVISQSAIPDKEVLKAIKDYSQYQIDIGLLEAEFPFPQVFVLKQITLVCFKSDIYEYKGSTLTLVYSGAPAGSTWTVADYNDYFVLTNGATLIFRDAVDKQYYNSAECSIPDCLCLCDVNGQLLIGCPGITVEEGFFG